MKMTTKLIALAVAAVTGTGSAAVAQDWPSGPLTVVVPFSTGGSSDLSARLLTDTLSERIGQPVVVQNRPGGGSTVGSTVVAQAQPDGQTVMLTSSSFVIAPNLFPDLSYDTAEDFAPIARVAINRHVLFTGPESGITSVEDLFDRLRDSDTEVTYGSAGIGSGTHLAIAAMLYEAGVEALHIPYPGAGPAKQAVASGEVDFGIDAVGSALSFLNEGTLVPLALQSLARDPLLPDTPTLDEGVLPGFENEAWLGVIAPAGVPDSTLEALNTALMDTMETDAVQQRFEQAGMVLAPEAMPAFSERVSADAARFADLIAQAGITQE